MKMAEIQFIYEGKNITIQCNENEKIEEIITRFLTKINNIENKNLIYLYNGTKINKELKYKEQANEIDKNSMKMDIIVTKFEDESDKKEKIISKEIICPTCNENILLDIKDYKINLNNCKNNHEIENILLDRFEETQNIILNEIKCNICEIKNKGNTFNNEFYLCITCNKNICPLCKSKHDKEHIIINYDEKNYICKNHNDLFIKYCKKCKKDICISCANEHFYHDKIDLSEILINENDLIKLIEDLKTVIDKFNYKINIIKEILDRMSNIINIYYQLNTNIINNYRRNKRNYFILLNINKIKNNSEKLIKELNNIINKDAIYEYSLNNFYNENGERYIGQLVNGKKNGNGIIYYVSGNRYEGDWKNDKKEGKGILYLNDGERYEGDWKNDKKEGKGIFYFKNGDKYEGDWKNNKLEGKGILFFYNGDKYEGDFKSDKKEGKGIYYWKNNCKYEGDWKNDIKEGKGIFYYNDGDKYEGDWKNDIREGKGIYYYNNGNKYEGDWKNDKKEGKGIFYSNDGKEEEGVWKDDKLQKKGYFKFW